MSIRDDPFVKRLIERIPVDEREGFSDEQLMSLKVAFGARTWGIHPVDLRWTISLWRKRYYFVFIAGVNRRPLSRCQKELAMTAKVLMFSGLIAFLTFLVLLVAYLLKSAAGINVFPEFSLGIWDWFKGVM